MKLSTSLATLTSALLLACQALVAQDYIVQTELDPAAGGYSAQIDVTGPEYTGTITGQVPAAFPISKYGSRFDIYTTIDTTEGSRVYKVATSIVGPYPTVTVTANTDDDSVDYENRTRADRRFGITVKVEGINSAWDAPISMRLVYVKHILKEYASDSYSFAATEDTSSWASAKSNDSGIGVGGVILANGTYNVKLPDVDDGLDTALTVLESSVTDEDTGTIDPTFAKGEEKVQIGVITPDALSLQMIHEETVRVFPYHSHEIVGSNDSFASSFTLSPVGDITEYDYIPSIAAVCSDAYPKSVTTLRLYKGTEANRGELVISTTDAVRNSEPYVLDESEPQNFSLILPQSTLSTLGDAGAGLDDGYYTVVLEYQTPYTDEDPFVVYSDFLLQRALKVRTHLNSGE